MDSSRAEVTSTVTLYLKSLTVVTCAVEISDFNPDTANNLLVALNFWGNKGDVKSNTHRLFCFQHFHNWTEPRNGVTEIPYG